MRKIESENTRWIKQCLMVLLCITFVGAPLTRATASGSIQVDITSGKSDDATSPQMPQMPQVPQVPQVPHMHDNEADDFSNSINQQCCPMDHDTMAGGFCADCLVFAMVSSPIFEQKARRQIQLTLVAPAHSHSLVGDTPVPKI